MNERKLAEINDDKVYAESRSKLLKLLPDASLLDLFEQMVINRGHKSGSKKCMKRFYKA